MRGEHAGRGVTGRDYDRGMRRLLILTTAALSLSSVARGASLAEGLPAGALATLETHDASGAVGRLAGVVGRVAATIGNDPDMAETIQGVQGMLSGSLAKEAVVGVFSVDRGRGKFSPEVLAVTRVDKASLALFGGGLPAKPGAKVGNYGFSRQGSMYVGQGGGLLYTSSDKSLLMSYLARLSGKAAPRLMNAPAYTTPVRAMGAQELSLFLNFSAVAKVARGALAGVMLPRLLSPVVDAVDTLGQYAAGFTTGAAGLSTRSAHLPNAQGKDRPLLQMLTHRSTFHVQDLIPADAEQVQGQACDPQSGPYLGRWLTRLDLLDPTGFLTDSQLASHLERSARYLGDECAQVTLAGAQGASLNRSDPLGSLRYSVTYQRVTDLDAASAHLPEYAEDVNRALQALPGALEPLLSTADLAGAGGMSELPGGAAGLAGTQAARQQLEPLLAGLKDVKMVYAFRGEYLITAFNDDALRAALEETPDTLGGSAAFQAAGLNLTDSAGWTFQGNPADLKAADVQRYLASMDVLPAGGAKDGGPDVKQLSALVADLVNRFDGMSAQARVQGTAQGDMVVRQGAVKYRW